MQLTQNPTKSFYDHYRSDIYFVRSSLFDEISNISTDFGKEAKKILTQKLAENDNRPLLGELFPWIICDLIKADKRQTKDISIGWLAIYLYTLFVDEYVDEPKVFSSSKFITGSLLLKTGLLNLSFNTSNKKYKKFIDDAFSFSAKNQQQDVIGQKSSNRSKSKVRYSEGKNYVVLACAGALASQNSKHSAFILNFTKKILLSLQYLDDIADLKKDFDSQNYTVLLSGLSKEFLSLSSKKVTRFDLISELIRNGSLLNVLIKLETLLKQSVALLKETQGAAKIHGKASELFYSLFVSIQHFRKYLSKEARDFEFLPNDQQKIIVDNVEKYIPIIAQST